MKKVTKGGQRHGHPDSEQEARNMPHITKQGSNAYMCHYCDKIVVVSS